MTRKLGHNLRPDEIPPHELCAPFMVKAMRKGGAEVEVRESPPAVMNPYVECFECPHGTKLWMQPTIGQHLEWSLWRTP